MSREKKWTISNEFTVVVTNWRADCCSREPTVVAAGRTAVPSVVGAENEPNRRATDDASSRDEAIRKRRLQRLLRPQPLPMPFATGGSCGRRTPISGPDTNHRSIRHQSASPDF